MTRANKSLRVARIMWPEYEWMIEHPQHGEYVVGRFKGMCRVDDFNHTTKEAGFDMACWLAKHGGRRAQVKRRLCYYDPNEALADAVIEIGSPEGGG